MRGEKINEIRTCEMNLERVKKFLAEEKSVNKKSRLKKIRL